MKGATLLLLLLAVIGVFVGVARAACVNPPAPYFTVEFETAIVNMWVPVSNLTIDGYESGTIVRDTVNLRDYSKLSMFSDRTGYIEVETWAFYDPSAPLSYNATTCLQVDGTRCTCGWSPRRWSGLVPDTAIATGKRTLAGQPCIVYSNNTDTYFVEITATADCVPGVERRINRYDLGMPMGGSLSNYYGYAAISEAEAAKVMVLPAECELSLAASNRHQAAAGLLNHHHLRTVF